MFFCLFCAAKVRIFREETKKSPKTLYFGKSSGREIMGLIKDYASGVVGVAGSVVPVSSVQPPTEGVPNLIGVASLVSSKV